MPGKTMKKEFRSQRVKENKNLHISLTLYYQLRTKVDELINLDSKIRRDHEKNFLWASRLWVGRQKSLSKAMSWKIMKKK